MLKRALFGLGGGTLVLLVLEGMARLVLPLATARLGVDAAPASAVLRDQATRARELLSAHTSRTALDTLVGWRYRPGYQSNRDTINSAGMRAAQEYSTVLSDSSLRVAAFGDSFIYSTEVTNDEAWSRLVERRYPKLEILNYGVGGYGTDQAFMLYLREGMRHTPQFVIIGFAPVNLPRAVNVYRRFISTAEPPLVKPRFILSGDSVLQLIPNPLPDSSDVATLWQSPATVLEDLGSNDAWYDAARYEFTALDWFASFRLVRALGIKVWRKCCWSERLVRDGKFREDTEAFRVQFAVLSAFADSVRSRGATPVIVIFPDIDAVLSIADPTQTVYAPLRDALARDSIAWVVDLFDAFNALPPDRRTPSLIAPGGHYSALGDQVVADWVGAVLSAERARRLESSSQ